MCGEVLWPVLVFPPGGRLGALLTASLDPAGEYPVPLASGCHPIPPEGGEETDAGILQDQSQRSAAQ